MKRYDGYTVEIDGKKYDAVGIPQVLSTIRKHRINPGIGKPFYLESDHPATKGPAEAAGHFSTREQAADAADALIKRYRTAGGRPFVSVKVTPNHKENPASGRSRAIAVLQSAERSFASGSYHNAMKETESAYKVAFNGYPANWAMDVLSSLAHLRVQLRKAGYEVKLPILNPRRW